MTLRRVLPLFAAALAGAGLLALAGLLSRPSEPATPKPAPTFTAAGRAFSIATPAGWRAVAHGSGALVLQRRDRRGLVVVRRRGEVRGSYATLARTLTRQLRRSLPDARPTSARVAQVAGTRGLVYTFVRPRARTVQSVVVAPTARGAYTLDLVADARATDVARQLGGIVRSFRVPA
jgi:hypothetical protein